MRFGKLLVDVTDLRIIDADPSDPFDLNLEEYAEHLVAGTSRTLTNMGRRADMAAYDSLAPKILADRTGKSHELRDRE